MAQNLCNLVKKLLLGAKSTKKPQNVEILGEFWLVFYLVLLIGAISLLKRCSVDILQLFCAKKVRANSAREWEYMAVYGDFARIFCPFKILFAQKLAYFSLGTNCSPPTTRTITTPTALGPDGFAAVKNTFCCL